MVAPIIFDGDCGACQEGLVNCCWQVSLEMLGDGGPDIGDVLTSAERIHWALWLGR